MLAQIVLIQQLLLHGRKAGIEHQGVQRHKGTFLQHGCVVDGIQGIPAASVQRFFDLSSGLTDRLNTLRTALGPRNPRLLTSARREQILDDVEFWRTP